MSYLADLWIKQFEPILKTLWESVGFWRVVSLIIITFIAGIIVFRRQIKNAIRNPDKIEHDRNIFEKADAILPERKLIDIFDLMQADHSYYCKDGIAIDEIIMFYEECQNRYFNDQLNAVTDSFINSIRKVREFICLKFFVYPKGQGGNNFRMCMHPNFNIDREGSGRPEEMKKYNQLTKELDELANKARKEYESYRNTIKVKLIV